LQKYCVLPFSDPRFKTKYIQRKYFAIAVNSQYPYLLYSCFTVFCLYENPGKRTDLLKQVQTGFVAAISTMARKKIFPPCSHGTLDRLTQSNHQEGTKQSLP
jgi:hypothetical protein